MGCGVFGQGLTFEVATVKPSIPAGDGGIRPGRRGGPGTADPTRATFSALTLRALLGIAYELKVYQILGSGWLDGERYDIVAKAPEGTTKEQFNVMLQNLLVERFNITLHREERDLPVYELSVVKSGAKIRPSAVGPDSPLGMPPGAPSIGEDGFPEIPPGRKAMVTAMTNGRAWTSGSGQAISALADMLANQLGAQVVDKTGLVGAYDFKFNFAPQPDRGLGTLSAPAPPPTAAPIPAGPFTASEPSESPAIMTAIQEQLGLKLDRKRAPVGVLVIDRADRMPAEN
jgi:uncharacterized protein (TIGR03435 family)